MGRTASEIKERGKTRALLLMDYLVNGTEASVTVRQGNFFRWFGEEKHEWYAILVLEECMQQAGSAEFDITGEVFLRMAMVLAGLYQRNFRKKQYYVLCEKVTGLFREGNRYEIKDLEKEYLVVLQNFSVIAGDYNFFEELDMEKAGNMYQMYLLCEGKSETVKRKYEQCEPFVKPLKLVEDKVVEEADSRNKEFEPIEADYVVGPEVEADDKHRQFFVGREEWLEQYSRRIIEGTDGIIMFFGQCRVGKSSCLTHLKERLKENYAIISISMDTITTESAFYDTVINSFKRCHGDKGKYRQLVREFLDYHGSDSFTENGFRQFIGEAHDLLQELETPRKLLLFIDEFGGAQYIDEIAKKQMFLPLLSGLVGERLLQVLITGSEDMEKCGEIAAKYYRKCNLEKLRYLSKDAMIQLLQEPTRMADGSSRFPDAEKLFDKIYWLTRGQPHITQMLGNEIRNKLNERKENFVTEQILDEIVNDIVGNWVEQGRVYFSALYGEDTEKLAIQVCGKLQNANLNNISEEEFRKALSEEEKDMYGILLKREVIVRDVQNNKANVYVGLFGEWCRQRYIF